MANAKHIEELSVSSIKCLNDETVSSLIDMISYH